MQAQAAGRISASMRPADHLARLGGPQKQDLAADAIVYASQHGLVSFTSMLQAVIPLTSMMLGSCVVLASTCRSCCANMRSGSWINVHCIGCREQQFAVFHCSPIHRVL